MHDGELFYMAMRVMHGHGLLRCSYATMDYGFMKIALLTPLLNHLPFHPGAYLGYGGAELRQNFEVDIIDLNAEIYYQCRDELAGMLSEMDESPIVVDNLSLEPFYEKLADLAYAKIDGIR